MNWILFHLLSGQLFFSGVALVVGGIGLSHFQGRLAARLGLFALIVGLLAVISSSTPLPVWQYPFLAASIVLWWITIRRPAQRRLCGLLVATVWIMVALAEASHHFMPSMESAKDRTLTVIGDSISAGIGDADQSETWPKILAREQSFIVQDLSRPGDSVSSALERIRRQPVGSSVVILEIGGNDLLGSGTSAEFGRDLDALLSTLSDQDRLLIMFELPLPPFHDGFGRVQRQLATKHQVKLLPKRVLLSILAGSGATIDSIHLSESGHRMMADVVWMALKPSFKQQEQPTIHGK